VQTLPAAFRYGGPLAESIVAIIMEGFTMEELQVAEN
jgi:hypothetical protein